ncbi:hypothetical protein [Vibrio tapetis]|uniref:Uncharacterized protein n=1 Tax=Vibrio tapetis subsp. tapetis TaxID=1671868 RepID=A0A2N8ZIE4_9VIBR|nr:hypothetical protein [Vibrio tapetis]SON51636.1 protein of unknown function [Vibrio tapetis subsp. tapetis]
MEQPIPPIFVTGALVLAKVRHGDDRQPIVIHIERTQLNLPYWGEGIARNNVLESLYQKVLNSVYTLIHWIKE